MVASAVATLCLSLTACSHSSVKARATARQAATSSTTGTTAATTTTSVAPKNTIAAKPLPGLGVGARGPQVLALEQRLAELHYDVGAVDGVYDGNTASAVTAFQKVTGMSRTGRATDDVLAAVNTATDPAPLVPAGGATRVEVDIARQVLFLYQGNALSKILPVSTGSGSRYCVDGECARAVTPGGSFRVFLRVSGWQTSRLGRLYNPLYFNGGIAIHGAPSVPAYPASHGCVRIPLSAAGWFPSKVPNGTPVYVKGGPIAPVPFNEPAPNGTPPAITAPPSTTAPPTTTTTTKPPSTLLPKPTTTTSTTLKPPGP